MEYLRDVTSFFVVLQFVYCLLTEAGATEKSDSVSNVKCNPYKNLGCDEFYTKDVPSPLQPGHKCQDYIPKRRGNDSSIIELLKNFDKQHKTIGWYNTHTYDTLYYVNGSEPGQEFLLCAMPKNGVTRLKILIMRVLGLRGSVHTQVHYPTVKSLSASERMRVLKDPKIPRIKIVRDPYVRAVSMYKDKMLGENPPRNGKYVGWNMKFDHQPSFGDFIKYLYQQYRSRKYVNRHFATQYEHCWERLGLEFDYILKIERMNYWYPCFVENFNLWKYVMNGWLGENQCYLSTPDVPCDGPYQDDQGAIQAAYGRDGVGSHHNRNAAHEYVEYYKNQTLARLTTDIYLNDIARYHYPYWSDFV